MSDLQTTIADMEEHTDGVYMVADLMRGNDKTPIRILMADHRGGNAKEMRISRAQFAQFIESGTRYLRASHLGKI